MTRFNQCPNYHHTPPGGLLGDHFKVYACKKCDRCYCYKCGDKRCPDCGSKEYSVAGECLHRK